MHIVGWTLCLEVSGKSCERTALGTGDGQSSSSGDSEVIKQAAQCQRADASLAAEFWNASVIHGGRDLSGETGLEEKTVLLLGIKFKEPIGGYISLHYIYISISVSKHIDRCIYT